MPIKGGPHDNHKRGQQGWSKSELEDQRKQGHPRIAHHIKISATAFMTWYPWPRPIPGVRRTNVKFCRTCRERMPVCGLTGAEGLEVNLMHAPGPKQTGLRRIILEPCHMTRAAHRLLMSCDKFAGPLPVAIQARDEKVLRTNLEALEARYG